ncbi:hypothetical protein [Gordonia sp. IITR100]|nr:hypothetical protein [Gordonia sp. IITR100]
MRETPGQFAPCPPPIVSTGPGDSSAPGHPEEEATPEIVYEYAPLPLPWNKPPEPPNWAPGVARTDEKGSEIVSPSRWSG